LGERYIWSLLKERRRGVTRREKGNPRLYRLAQNGREKERKHLSLKKNAAAVVKRKKGPRGGGEGKCMSALRV